MTEALRPNRSMPEDIIPEIQRLENCGIRDFNIRRFRNSMQNYRQSLRLMNRSQRRIRRPIHKGSPYYMIGLCYTGLNDHNRALRYIVLAYIEDTLNVNFGEEDEADRMPAARVLRDYYGIQIAILREIKELVNGVKEAGNWTQIFRPENLLCILEQRTGIDRNNLVPQLTRPPPRVPRRQPFGFPQPWERRVFIGGNYQTHMPIIRHIERIVAECGYTPVVAFDVDIPRENTHDFTILLLHTCGYAIFEISTPAGQLMEIERTQDYANNVLLFFSRIEPDAPPSPYVTTMLQTMTQFGERLRIEGYEVPDDMEPIISDFLPQL